MAQTPFGNEGPDKAEEDLNNAEFELTDEEGRNKVRNLIFKTLTDADEEEDLQNKQHPPNVLTQMLEDEIFKGINDCEKSIYKTTSNKIIKRLTGTRFAEARKQL
jgi:hypothetical protein